MKEACKYSVTFSLFSLFLSEIIPWSRIQGRAPNKLVRPAAASMAEHNTQSKTTDHLEEAITCLTQNQSTLTDAHHDLTLRLDSIQDQLLQFQLHHSHTYRLSTNHTITSIL